MTTIEQDQITEIIAMARKQLQRHRPTRLAWEAHRRPGETAEQCRARLQLDDLLARQQQAR